MNSSVVFSETDLGSDVEIRELRGGAISLRINRQRQFQEIILQPEQALSISKLLEEMVSTNLHSPTK